MRGKNGGVVVAFLVVGLGLMAIFGRSEPSFLDPDSTRPDGARALVLLLGEFAESNSVLDQVPGPEVDVAVLLVDRLAGDASMALDDWVSRGGVLIVADPGSPYVPPLAAVDNLRVVDSDGASRGQCDMKLAAGAKRVSAPLVVRYEDAGSDGVCFANAEGAYVHRRPFGDGAIISVGGGGAFTNNLLDEADNSVLAVALMVPESHGSVAILRREIEAPESYRSTAAGGSDPRRRRVGDGSSGIADLMPDYMQWVALNLALAALVLAIASGRRLGHPVSESQPVVIAGNELVMARGRLLRRVDTSATVGSIVDGFRADISNALGLPPGTPDDRISEVAAARSGLDIETISRALATNTVRDDAQLVKLTRSLDRIRQEVRND